MIGLLKASVAGGAAGFAVMVLAFALDLGGLTTLVMETEFPVVAAIAITLNLVSIFAVGGLATGYLFEDPESGSRSDS